jgi:hypothetical protein
MKKSVAIAIGSALVLVAGMPLAQDAKAPASTPKATATQSLSSTNMSSQMRQMDDRMKTMQALHDRTMSATTPEERQKVMDEQRNEMQGSMAMMNQMMQGGAKMGGMGSGMTGRAGKPADANVQLQMMQKRIDMMQMMLQTMQDQQGMMAGPRSIDTAPKK